LNRAAARPHIVPVEEVRMPRPGDRQEPQPRRLWPRVLSVPDRTRTPPDFPVGDLPSVTDALWVPPDLTGAQHIPADPGPWLDDRPAAPVVPDARPGAPVIQPSQ